jgi:hypothetical protein
MPLFMKALLPILLSPSVKTEGITGVGKLYAWIACSEQSHNYAELLNNKLWDSRGKDDTTKRYIRILSQRAQEAYVSILSSQVLNEWNHEVSKAKRFGSENLQTMIHYYLPALEDFLSRDCPYFGAEEELLRDPRLPLKEDGLLMDSWRAVWKKWREPLYFYSEYCDKKKRNIERKIHIDILNVPLVCAAREQYLDRLGSEVRSVLSPSIRTKGTWLLDIDISVKLRDANPRPILRHGYEIPLWVIPTSPKWTEKNVDMPLWLPIFPFKSFCLSTKDEFITFGKVTSRDPSWDGKEPLVAEQGDPITLPATYARLEMLNNFLELGRRLQPEKMLVREYLKDASYTGKTSMKMNRFLIKHLKSFKRFSLPNFQDLLHSKGGIVPGFPGV